MHLCNLSQKQYCNVVILVVWLCVFIFLVQRYRQIEGRVVEISQLQEIFSEKVLHQVRMLTNS